MRKSSLLALAILLGGMCSAYGQTATTPASPNAAFYPTDPMSGVLNEVMKISASVNSLTKQMKLFVDKFEKVGGVTFNEKQQKLVLGMELLARAEMRVTTFQKAQIELTEKLNETRTKLTQTEIDLRPTSIERSVALIGSTETEELRDARRTRLQAERTSLTQLFQQIQANLAENNRALQDAQSLAERLRKLYLPQIEREIYEQ
jgi:molybdenum cofactor biosynthesis enzyme MoaA